jgi:hypothetical protein
VKTISYWEVYKNMLRGKMKGGRAETGIKKDCEYEIDMYDGCIVMLTTSLKSHEPSFVLQAKSNESLLE